MRVAKRFSKLSFVRKEMSLTKVGLALIVLVLAVLVSAGCGGDSSPTAPSSSTGSLNLTGTFSGEASDSFGPGLQFTWQLTQSGTAVSGTMVTRFGGSLLATGTVSGTLSGTIFTFIFTIPPGGIPSLPTCSSTANGTAPGVTNTTIAGTYSGVNSCLGPFTNGRFTLTRQ